MSIDIDIDNKEITQLLRGGSGRVMRAPINLPPIEDDDGSPISVDDIALTEPALDIMQKRADTGLHGHMVTDAALARDLALFGESHLDQIMQAYNLNQKQMQAKRENPAFQTLYTQYRNDLDKDKHGGLRARSSAYLDVLMERLFTLSMKTDATAQHVLKTAQFMASVADALPRSSGDGIGGGTAGVHVTFQIGEKHPLIKDTTSINIIENPL